jgi:hypothetical protein
MAKDKNPYITIGASLGGIYAIIVFLFLIFAPYQAQILIPIAYSFSGLGIVLGYFSSKKKK